MGVERLDEIDEYGALGRCEFPIPDDVNSEISLEKKAVVVFENEGLLLDKCRELSGCSSGRV